MRPGQRAHSQCQALWLFFRSRNRNNMFTGLRLLISDDDESAYRDDVKHLVRWCASNDLVLNLSKTKEIVVDFRKSKSVPCPSTLIVNNSEVEIVDSFKFLGIHITLNLSWSTFSALPQEISYETRNPSDVRH